MKGFALVLLTSTMLVACAEGDLPNTGQVEKSSEAPPIVQPPVEEPQINPLSVSASVTQIAIKQTTSFSAAGGTAPYTYAVVGTSAGSLSNNIYTASIVGEAVRVRVTDAKGVVAETTVSVTWPALRDIFRGRNAGSGYHYYTNDMADGYFANYTSQGVGYRLLANPVDDQTKPFYRCFVSVTGGYFQTDRSDCENLPQYPNAYQNQGVLGHIYKTQRPGLVPVQRFSGGYDHFDSIKGTADPDAGGYNPEGVFGYALPPAAN